MSTTVKPLAQKICAVCGADVSNQKRIKDDRGNYYCHPCYQSHANHRGDGSAVAAATLTPAPAQNCPFCGELNAAGAIQCAFCGEAIVADQPLPTSQSNAATTRTASPRAPFWTGRNTAIIGTVAGLVIIVTAASVIHFRAKAEERREARRSVLLSEADQLMSQHSYADAAEKYEQVEKMGGSNVARQKNGTGPIS